MSEIDDEAFARQLQQQLLEEERLNEQRQRQQQQQQQQQSYQQQQQQQQQSYQQQHSRSQYDNTVPNYGNSHMPPPSDYRPDPREYMQQNDRHQGMHQGMRQGMHQGMGQNMGQGMQQGMGHRNLMPRDHTVPYDSHQLRDGGYDQRYMPDDRQAQYHHQQQPRQQQQHFQRQGMETHPSTYHNNRPGPMRGQPNGYPGQQEYMPRDRRSPMDPRDHYQPEMMRNNSHPPQSMQDYRSYPGQQQMRPIDMNAEYDPSGRPVQRMPNSNQYPHEPYNAHNQGPAHGMEARAFTNAPPSNSEDSDMEIAKRLQQLEAMGLGDMNSIAFSERPSAGQDSIHTATTSTTGSSSFSTRPSKSREQQEEEDARLARMMAETGTSLRNIQTLPPNGSQHSPRNTQPQTSTPPRSQLDGSYGSQSQGTMMHNNQGVDDYGMPATSLQALSMQDRRSYDNQPSPNIPQFCLPVTEGQEYPQHQGPGSAASRSSPIPSQGGSPQRPITVQRSASSQEAERGSLSSQQQNPQQLQTQSSRGNSESAIDSSHRRSGASTPTPENPVWQQVAQRNSPKIDLIPDDSAPSTQPVAGGKKKDKKKRGLFNFGARGRKDRGNGSSSSSSQQQQKELPNRPPIMENQRSMSGEATDTADGNNEQKRVAYPLPQPVARPKDTVGAPAGPMHYSYSISADAPVIPEATAARRPHLSLRSAGSCALCVRSLPSQHIAALNSKFHKECFRCLKCQEPIDAAGTFAYIEKQGKKQPLHRKCYAELYGIKCTVCANTIPAGQDGRISFVKHPFFDTEQMCPHHAANLPPRCTGCHRFEPENAPFLDLNDSGRKVCPACCRNVILDSAEAKPLWDKVVEFFETKLELPIWRDFREVPILIVGYNALNHQMSASQNVHGGALQIMTRGLCLTEHEAGKRFKMNRMKFDKNNMSLRAVDKEARGFTYFQVPDADKVNPDSSVTAILCLSGLPKDLVASVLAHEATHAWIKLHPKYDMRNPIPPQVEEGCAQLIALLFLNDGLDPAPPLKNNDGTGPSDEKLRQYFRFSIETDDNDIYGTGYRKAAQAYSKVGVLTLMTHVVMYQNFPTV